MPMIRIGSAIGFSLSGRIRADLGTRGRPAVAATGQSKSPNPSTSSILPPATKSSRGGLEPRPVADTVYAAGQSGQSTEHSLPFDHLGLSADLLRAVADEGYITPTPVQEQAIPLVLQGRDLLAAAQTGTGKTAAFVLPILERLRAQASTSFSPARHPVRALIITPTRELAMQ